METTLATFLKKHSAIPNTFIDDMFELYDPDTAQSDFAVNLDAVSKWLRIHKHNLMKTLKASYIKGIDFTAVKAINPRHVSGRKYGNNNYNKVLITVDCFKRLCMRSHGATAESVRSYFIQVETLVVKYRKQLIEGMTQDIKRLESAASARRHTKASSSGRSGYIYVLRASGKNASLVKIGRTKDLSRRLREHAAALADDPEVLYIFKTDDADAVESCIKAWLKTRQWASPNKYKEVYKADIDMVKAIIQKCEAVGDVVKKADKLTGGGARNIDDRLFLMVSRDS